MADLNEIIKSIDSNTTLCLAYIEIGDAGAASLAKALELNKTITIIELVGNKFGDDGATAKKLA